MRVLVTGHTGSLGKELVSRLTAEGHEVVGVSRCEFKQSQQRGQLTQYLCDIRDRDRMLEATRGIDLVYHTAAMKRIESCEEQPDEAVSVNVRGTENVLFCQRINKIPRVVLVSTDKAVYPITCYGYTKSIAECLVLRNPNNVVTRYGNVLASRGSVLQSFVHSIRTTGTYDLTHPDCTRFWWTLGEAAEYVEFCAARPEGGLCIPHLKAAPVTWLAGAVAHALETRAMPQVTGLRGKEKIHEDLRSDDEGGRVHSGEQGYWFSKEELQKTVGGLIA